jgi:hypothetical protein
VERRACLECTKIPSNSSTPFHRFPAFPIAWGICSSFDSSNPRAFFRGGDIELAHGTGCLGQDGLMRQASRIVRLSRGHFVIELIQESYNALMVSLYLPYAFLVKAHLNLLFGLPNRWIRQAMNSRNQKIALLATSLFAAWPAFAQSCERSSSCARSTHSKPIARGIQHAAAAPHF